MKDRFPCKIILFVMAISFLALILPGCTWGSDASGTGTGGAKSVAELLRNPVYETEVITYGRVSSLNETSSPYFELISEEKTIRVWYDSMVDKDGTEKPRVDFGGVKNGHKVVVLGELKEDNGLYHRKNDFWATEIGLPCYQWRD